MPKLTGRRFVADYLKIPELARRLDVSEKTARRYIKAGTLPSTFIGGAYRVTEKDLEEFLHRAEVKPEDASPKAESRSSLEPSLFNGTERERRAPSIFSEALITIAERLENIEPPQSLADVLKRFGILEVLYDVVEPLDELAKDPKAWEDFGEERQQLSLVGLKVHQVARQLLQQNDEYLEHRREDREARREAEAAREQIREWTRRLSA
jgi:excisionase family DNA binding protein